MTQDEYNQLLEQCRLNRAYAYPPIGDQLDAAFHARQGDPSAQQAIDQEIASVKAQYPKPDPSQVIP